MMKWQVPPWPEKDPAVHAAMRKKLAAVWDKGYITKGTVMESLTSFFAILKGNDDIWMACNGTSSGLKSVLWAPSFPLLTVENYLQAMSGGYYMGDIDVGEMFLNFIMHERIWMYC